EGLVGEQVDPHLPAALDVPGHGHAGRLDLPVGDPARLQGQEAVVAEMDLGPTLGLAAHAATMLLAVLDPLGREHLGPAPSGALGPPGATARPRSALRPRRPGSPGTAPRTRWLFAGLRHLGRRHRDAFL